MCSPTNKELEALGIKASIVNWECPVGCHTAKGVVCGGHAPYYNHGLADPETERMLNGKSPVPDVFFWMDLVSDRYEKVPLTNTLSFALTDEDWEDMFDHAEFRCPFEAECPDCGSSLKRVAGDIPTGRPIS